MTKLIDKDDPYFHKLDKLYDRHHYRIVCQNKSFVVESWDEVQEWWWNNCRHLFLKVQLFMLLINQKEI